MKAIHSTSQANRLYQNEGVILDSIKINAYKQTEKNQL